MAPNSFVVLDICLATLGLVLLRKLWLSRRQKYRLPPGPSGFPLLGNVLDMPSEQEWLTFAQWGEAYGLCSITIFFQLTHIPIPVGDICSVTVLGQTIVVLNSLKAAVDILDKKSSIYSDRPILQMGGELVGWKNTLALLPYGDRFRRYRKIFHRLIGSPATMRQYHPALELETQRFLQRVLRTPSNVQDHIRKTAGAIILRISHGYEVNDAHDPFVHLADLATEQFSLATSPGQFLVDVFPPLRHIPNWFPGARFKRTAKEWASTLTEMVEQPHNYVKQQIAAGTAMPSFSSSLLQNKSLTEEEEFDLKWSTASLYSGKLEPALSSRSKHP
ncbi:hypothetical protein PM082_005005 [Marasmius tenuissimus]|nr:hypothetical protein PM082_005005 [Marasmius tenuissimus]